ncbi:MAG: hypothetical protein Harvfovirus10_5 [Harvfovirus sp.]|uniref:Uncharacterized protein n=1 Tax=Harvfovirus sp. TaxID=2487768 RepID=A0A3G5A121_9VIRU|nr:MAG: hypothetical protein Harvfovirus10_5 [Harvfovirus sp.]
MSSQGRQDSIRQTRHELAPFFGNHGGAELFIKLFIEPTVNYETAINGADANSIINNNPYAYQFLKAESYGRKDPASDNDIHSQVVDFLAEVAKFHRTIDPPAQALPHAPSPPESKILWDDVFMKWKDPDFTENAKIFYRKYLQFMTIDTAGADAVIPEAKYGDQTIMNQPQKRVNLLKTNSFGGPRTNPMTPATELIAPCPKFTNLIPQVPNTVKKMWFTDAAGQQVSLIDPLADALKEFYCKTYKFGGTFTIGAAAINIKPNWNPASKYEVFNINIDKFTRKRFFKIMSEIKKPPKVEGPVFSLADKNIWHVDESNRLYKEENGTKVYYDEDSDASKRIMTAEFKCYSTLANASVDKCNFYVNQCLLRSDPESLSNCTEYWKNHDFYKATKDEIKDMHPMVAVRTLQKFGFRVKKMEDPECKMQVKKFESVDHWLKTVLTKGDWQKPDPNNAAGGKFQNTIEDNENLLNYLKLVVEYVNANPAVLNGKEFAAKTSEAIGRVKQSDLAVRLGIQMAKVPASRYQGMYDYSMLQSHVGSFRSQVPRNPLAGSFGGPGSRSSFGSFGSEIGIGMPFQLGGVPNIDSYIRRVESNSISGASALQALIDSRITDLKNRGIFIDLDDQTSIVKKIDTMKKIEDELISTAMILDAYSKIQYLFPGNRSEMLSMDKVKAFVEKYKDLVSTQANEETALVKIYGALEKLLVGQSDDFVDQGYETLGSVGFNTTEISKQTVNPFDALNKRPPCF